MQELQKPGLSEKDKPVPVDKREMRLRIELSGDDTESGKRSIDLQRLVEMGHQALTQQAFVFREVIIRIGTIQ